MFQLEYSKKKIEKKETVFRAKFLHFSNKHRDFVCPTSKITLTKWQGPQAKDSYRFFFTIISSLGKFYSSISHSIQAKIDF